MKTSKKLMVAAAALSMAAFAPYVALAGNGEVCSQPSSSFEIWFYKVFYC